MNAEELPERLPARERFKTALPAIAVFLLGIFLAFGSARTAPVSFNLENITTGSFILSGVYDTAVSGSMPLYDTLATLAVNLGINPLYFMLAALSGVYILVFSTACLLRGYRAGIVSLALVSVLPAPPAGWDIEQVFFSFFILLVLALLILRQRENTLKNSLLAGLAIGASLLARTPLFLFPFLVVGCDWLCSAERRGFVPRSLLFLAAAYALLLPGAVVKEHISGKFSLLDDRRAASNIITGARGSVYTMEGDYRKLAGLGANDSPTAFFVREVAKAPFSYALSVLGRLLAIFRFNPWVFGLFLAALPALRGTKARRNFLLPAYFILIHSLLSVEDRYFYPMMYVIPPLAIAALFPRRFEGDIAPGLFPVKALRALFRLSFCLVLLVEGLLLAYPLRSGNSFSREALLRAAGRFPNDRVLWKMRCDESRWKGDYAAYYACLDGYNGRFGDEVKGYFLRARISPKPAALPLPPGLELNCLIIRMLRELELGDRDAAMNSFRQAYARYEGEANGLRGTPYERDREIQRLIRRDSHNFWDRYFYDALLLWPPAGIAKILSGLERSGKLTPKLKLLEFVAANSCRSGGMLYCLSKRDDIFSALAPDILRPRRSDLALLTGKAGPGRPAATAYLRALSAAPAPDRILLREGISEEELYPLLAMRGMTEPGPALEKTGEVLILQQRPFYFALRALFSLESGRADELRKSLDALGPSAENPDLLRFLAWREAAAGNKKLARELEVLSVKVRPAIRKSVNKAQRRSKELSDLAVEKMRAGDLKATESILLEALDKDKHNPEALMNLCSLRSGENKKEKALEACRGAADAVYSDPARRMPGLELMASEASFASYRLLLELGRKDEALETLRRCVELAPAFWPGLPAAKKELAGAGRKRAE